MALAAKALLQAHVPCELLVSTPRQLPEDTIAMAELGKLLVLFGIAMVAVGLLLILFGTHLPLGRLPGDLLYRGKNTTVYFPLATSLLLSVVFSLVLYLIRHFRR
jgi:Protein of unknown function (DUF2905)